MRVLRPAATTVQLQQQATTDNSSGDAPNVDGTDFNSIDVIVHYWHFVAIREMNLNNSNVSGGEHGL